MNIKDLIDSGKIKISIQSEHTFAPKFLIEICNNKHALLISREFIADLSCQLGLDFSIICENIIYKEIDILMKKYNYDRIFKLDRLLK